LLILEGLLPFVSPKLFKKAIFEIKELGEMAIRFMGFIFLITGALILYLL
jgi:uncharacterized protein YjeT (DUF2065 family)